MVCQGIVIILRTFQSLSADFWSNLAATIIGVVVGIPIALLVNDIIQKSETKKQKKQILISIKGELILNLRAATNILEVFERDGHLVSTPFMKDEFWKTITHGGEFQWISQDIDLVGKLSGIYHSIYISKFLEIHYYDLMINNPGMIGMPIRELKYKEACHPVEKVFDDLKLSYFVTTDLIEKILKDRQFANIKLETDPVEYNAVG